MFRFLVLYSSYYYFYYQKRLSFIMTMIIKHMCTLLINGKILNTCLISVTFVFYKILLVLDLCKKQKLINKLFTSSPKIGTASALKGL